MKYFKFKFALLLLTGFFVFGLGDLGVAQADESTATINQPSSSTVEIPAHQEKPGYPDDRYSLLPKTGEPNITDAKFFDSNGKPYTITIGFPEGGNIADLSLYRIVLSGFYFDLSKSDTNGLCYAADHMIDTSTSDLGWGIYDEDTVITFPLSTPYILHWPHTVDFVPVTITINFVDEDGTAISSPKELTINLEKISGAKGSDSTGANGRIPQVFANLTPATLAQASRDIPGYTAKTVTEDPDDYKVPYRVEDGQPEAYDYNFTYHYVKTPTKPDQPTTTPDTSSTTPAESTSSESTSESGTEPDTTTPVAVKGEAVTATKKIGLYRHATFTKANRLHWYAKQARTQRPQFVVTGYAHSKNGLLRYQVRDVNPTAKTDGQRGYITAKDAYVTPTYYQKQPTTVRVISPRGINAYRHVDLSGRATQHYRRGSVLKIRGIEQHHLTTRLVLANGHYITGNKTLVIKK